MPAENGLEIQVEVFAPVPIHELESRTHPISVKLGRPTATNRIRDLASASPTSKFDPRKAQATLSDQATVLAKDFVLLILAEDRTILASRALLEPHPSLSDHSALMVTINPQELFPSEIAIDEAKAEIVFVADRSSSTERGVVTCRTSQGSDGLPDDPTRLAVGCIWSLLVFKAVTVKAVAVKAVAVKAVAVAVVVLVPDLTVVMFRAELLRPQSLKPTESVGLKECICMKESARLEKRIRLKESAWGVCYFVNLRVAKERALRMLKVSLDWFSQHQFPFTGYVVLVSIVLNLYCHLSN